MSKNSRKESVQASEEAKRICVGEEEVNHPLDLTHWRFSAELYIMFLRSYFENYHPIFGYIMVCRPIPPLALKAIWTTFDCRRCRISIPHASVYIVQDSRCPIWLISNPRLLSYGNGRGGCSLDDQLLGDQTRSKTALRADKKLFKICAHHRNRHLNFIKQTQCQWYRYLADRRQHPRHISWQHRLRVSLSGNSL